MSTFCVHSAKEIQSSNVPKTIQCNVLFCFVFSGIEFKLKGMLGSNEKIQSLEDMKKTIPSQSTKLTGTNIHLCQVLLGCNFVHYQDDLNYFDDIVKICSEMLKT